MGAITNTIIDSVDTFLAWLSSALYQTTQSYCDIQTADSRTDLVAHDGSLLSVMRVRGYNALIGAEEFDQIQVSLQQSLQTTMSRPGHTLQIFFSYNKDTIDEEIRDILKPGHETAKRIQLDLDDLFEERVSNLSAYCASEEMFIVLWTRPKSLTTEQNRRANKDKTKMIKDKKIPAFRYTQNLISAIPDLRESHGSFVRAVASDFNAVGIATDLLNVHDAVYHMRRTVDPDFTAREWRPLLPGDKITIKESERSAVGDISDIMWPSLARQLLPRDAENVNLRTARIGDRIYASVFIDLFPKEVQTFATLFGRTLQTQIPWRISFCIESDGLASLKLKSALTSVLSFASAQNRLFNDSVALLNYINLNTDDAVVRLRVTATTWAPEGEIRLLRSRAAQLAKAIEGWGSCDVSEVSGDAFAGTVSSMLGVSGTSVATASVAPLSDVLYMMPFRPSSPWDTGAILFRSPDGKPWPYQPGSRYQTTWIDLIYARPGSGKSVLSSAINLALCLSPGIKRLPRIAIIDIGPSSSGLISLLKEALPKDQRHYAVHYRMQMSPEYAINPFDTQLGARTPTPQERSFLVNFLTLLATPVGSEKPYDGIADMSGMIVDELYKHFKDDASPNVYQHEVEEEIDGILEEIGFVRDSQTTWWEVTDALFTAGFVHEAMMAHRHAMPTLADAASICRLPAIEDLYGKIVAPTGEPLIDAFGRMISGAVREYPVIAQVTKFDIGDARVVALDLDEVAKSGGDAANRQTAVMYMLARYALGRHFFLTEESLIDVPDVYKSYHETRITEIREDPKRLVMDEFHRTSKVQAVRDQVIQDMREGRKWKVQIALLSQSLDDFDEVMVEFGTSVFIMDAGPEQAIRKTTETFGLSQTAQSALRAYVHGPREGGATFLAQFATKDGMNTQLLTATLGPVELWAFSTTAEDMNVRNRLYSRLGPAEARRVLANLFPSGSATKVIEEQLETMKDTGGMIDEDAKEGIIDEVIDRIIRTYSQDPNARQLLN